MRIGENGLVCSMHEAPRSQQTSGIWQNRVCVAQWSQPL